MDQDLDGSDDVLPKNTCDISLADIDGDGAVNPLDIDPFIALLTGG